MNIIKEERFNSGKTEHFHHVVINVEKSVHDKKKININTTDSRVIHTTSVHSFHLTSNFHFYISLGKHKFCTYSVKLKQMSRIIHSENYTFSVYITITYICLMPYISKVKLRFLQ